MPTTTQIHKPFHCCLLKLIFLLFLIPLSCLPISLQLFLYFTPTFLVNHCRTYGFLALFCVFVCIWYQRCLPVCPELVPIYITEAEVFTTRAESFGSYTFHRRVHLTALWAIMLVYDSFRNWHPTGGVHISSGSQSLLLFPVFVVNLLL